ncbi:riboflavin synthase [Sphingomicrobium sediminis]|uniref:Riboflavin synthase n=1 Tax=Sphingomicrobium sediminis TaxID=2950949 RepID=A0A9X2EIG7_9SPHN|nr:riboflavin synthase [Sphingomicrobium sediminis]MCM8558125.1 riboflavin synthase [Sphingomicrobium sediminis]
MFTGIITDIGTIRSVEERGDWRLVIGCGYDMDGVAMGASIACSGACLTVVDKGADWFAVDISAESIKRTAPGLWAEGGKLNLERALKMGDELGGHIVTGHVDTVAEVLTVEQVGDSHEVGIVVPKHYGAALAPKGSVTLDGVSLTVNTVEDKGDDTHFTINLIPHTGQETTLGGIAPGRKLNLEIDVLARYLERMMAART